MKTKLITTSICFILAIGLGLSFLPVSLAGNVTVKQQEKDEVDVNNFTESEMYGDPNTRAKKRLGSSTGNMQITAHQAETGIDCREIESLQGARNLLMPFLSPNEWRSFNEATDADIGSGYLAGEVSNTPCLNASAVACNFNGTKVYDNTATDFTVQCNGSQVQAFCSGSGCGVVKETFDTDDIYCNFSGTQGFATTGGADIGITCRGGKVIGICHNTVASGYNDPTDFTSCVPFPVIAGFSNLVQCPFSGVATYIYGNDAGGNYGMTCTGNIVTGWCDDSTQSLGGTYNNIECTYPLCTGANPSNATMCAGDDQGLLNPTVKRPVVSCSSDKCEWRCASGYIPDGNDCRLAICTAPPSIPNNSTMCAGDSFPLPGDTPINPVDHGGCTGGVDCQWECNAGFSVCKGLHANPNECVLDGSLAGGAACCEDDNCVSGTCVGGFCGCTPDCSGKICGDDGCGGSCGSCSAPTSYCNAAQDACVECTEHSHCSADPDKPFCWGVIGVGDCVADSDGAAGSECSIGILNDGDTDVRGSCDESGTCSASCSSGTLTWTNNCTPTPASNCAAGVDGSVGSRCIVSAMSHGDSKGGSCDENGTCSASCDDGSLNWVNNCSPTAAVSNCSGDSNGPAGAECSVGAINHGSGSVGSCDEAGSCTATCNDGTLGWTNNCTAYTDCTGTFNNGPAGGECTVSNVDHGQNKAGSCDVVGSCSATCSDGVLSWSNSCGAGSCSAQNFGSGASQCSVPSLPNGSSGGSCAENGTCSYKCVSGGLNFNSNSCNAWDDCDGTFNDGTAGQRCTASNISHSSFKAGSCDEKGFCVAGCSNGAVSWLNNCAPYSDCTGTFQDGSAGSQCEVSNVDHGENKAGSCDQSGSCSATCNDGTLSWSNSCIPSFVCPAGCTAESSGGVDFCRCAAASCPAGWEQFGYWSTTTSRYYNGCDDGDDCGICTDCTTGSHTWGNTPTESCDYDVDFMAGSCGLDYTDTVFATVTEIGCIPNGTFACSGGSPDPDAELCSGSDSNLTSDVNATLGSSCGSTRCRYTCKSGYVFSGGECKFKNWVNGSSTASGRSCTWLCSQLGYLSTTSPEGYRCASGELRPSSGDGVISYGGQCEGGTGCNPWTSSGTAPSIEVYQEGWYMCYETGQPQDTDHPTDRRKACYCQES